jgi:hypothetical protein
MMVHLFNQIDWHRPWLSVLQPAATPILHAPDWRVALNAAATSQGLCNHRGLPIHFVLQSELPSGTAYEEFISVTGRVPTRNNLHDFFNALVWLTFPQVKAQLNALQAAEIAKSNSSSDKGNAMPTSRGKLRDGATIFDENAALVITSDAELIDALRNHQWHEVFGVRRAIFETGCDVILFGHALMEKLVMPYKAITAHTWLILSDPVFFAMSPDEKRIWIDTTVAVQLADGFDTRSFTPLPILGVPGWWRLQDSAFYDDPNVFRPKRRAVV